jgi:hypothetical protein
MKAQKYTSALKDFKSARFISHLWYNL